jgi:hypothetical protein
MIFNIVLDVVSHQYFKNILRNKLEVYDVLMGWI